jgi:hypothetical protein
MVHFAGTQLSRHRNIFAEETIHVEGMVGKGLSKYRKERWVVRSGVQRKPVWNISLPKFETLLQFGILHADELEESMYHMQGSLMPISQPPPAYKMGIRPLTAPHQSGIMMGVSPSSCQLEQFNVATILYPPIVRTQS